MGARAYTLPLEPAEQRVSDVYGGTPGVINAVDDIPYRQLLLSASGANATLRAAGSASYSALVLADSPIGYWRLGEASGTTAVDSSGNGRHGTYSPSVVLGQPGLSNDDDLSAEFGAVAARVDLSNIPIPNTLTFECLFRPTNTPVNFARLWSSGSVVSFPLDIGWDNALQLIYFINFSTLTPGWLATGWTATVGVTYHLAFTFDGVWIRLYINGAQVYSNNAFSGLTVVNAGATAGRRAIGNVSADDAGTGAEFTGYMDEVALYSRALSAEEVAEHFAAALAYGVELVAGAAPLRLGPYRTGPMKLSNFSASGSGSTLHVLGVPF